MNWHGTGKEIAVMILQVLGGTNRLSGMLGAIYF